MANEKKLYYPVAGPLDTQLISNDGGGILMNNEGKFFFSAVSQEKLEELYAKQFEGNLPTNFNDVSIIGIMNQNSTPRSDFEEGSTNRTSITNPTPNNTIPTPDSSNICGGNEKDNNEFVEAAKIFSLWEELNSNAGKIISEESKQSISTFDDNGYSKSETFLNALINDPKVIDIIDNNISLNGTSFKNLGWGKYGSGKPTLVENTSFMYSDYWVTNKAANNTLNDPSNSSFKKDFTNPLTNTTAARSIFDIQTLPSGLRTMCLRNNYNSGQLWINRILTTVGPDYLNKENLGITIKESRSDGLSFPDKIKKFHDQYDQIIAVYNENKQVFLETLAKENVDFTVRLVDQKLDKRFEAQPVLFKTFYQIYINLALYIAIKYKDCPNEFKISSSTLTQSQPEPIIKQSTPKKSTTYVSENEEGLYETEFDGLYEIEFQALPDKEPIKEEPTPEPAPVEQPKADNQKKKILIVGDSITAEFYNGQKTGNWSVMFKDSLKNSDVKILAISGKQLTAWMKPELEKELKVNKYDKVYIYGGVNDAFSSKTSSKILTDLQSMVNTVAKSGAQPLVIVGYDGQNDMDTSKMKFTPYVKTREKFDGLKSVYVAYQNSIPTVIKGAVIIPKVQVGVLSDGFHPYGEKSKILYQHVSKY